MADFCKVLVFSIPRTGTNHLFYTLRNVERLNVRFEMFNKDEAYTISKEEVRLLAEKFGTSWDDNRDPEFIDWSARNPAKLLNFLAGKVAPNFDNMIFKLFPNQLTMGQLKALLTETPNLRAIFIRRRPIDSFISMMKSIQTQKYLNHNTSGLMVDLCPRYFMEWWSSNYNWYRMAENLVEKFSVPNLALSYEGDIDVGDEALRQNIIAVGKSIGLNFIHSTDQQYKGLEKQDKETRYEKKVANWVEFEAVLRAEHFYDRAFGTF